MGSQPDFSSRAATRIGSQKILLATICAAQRNAQDPGIRRRQLDYAFLSSILKSSEMLLIQFSIAKSGERKDVKEKLSDYLDRFDSLACSGRFDVPNGIPRQRKLAKLTLVNRATIV